jgi:TonB-linked SusC/RagA family outer membrane protein
MNFKKLYLLASDFNWPKELLSRQKLLLLSAVVLYGSVAPLSAHELSEPKETVRNHKRASLKSQVKEIKGNVADEKGGSLPGVTVALKGTLIGTLTDVNGNFSLVTPDDSGTLVFSFVGYTTQEIQISGATQLKVTLQPSETALQEVVVVGYGSIKKRDLTSSITELKPGDLIQGAVSPLLAMQGKVPGLTINADNGTDPNSGISLQLRGVNSINASQGPLVVIDGIPGGNINSVVKEDIASISVLRDASAAAIYGTRASGGVVLITTKSPKSGALQATFTSELFVETIRKRPQVLSAEQFVSNGLGEDKGHRTDWYDKVTVHNPFSQRYVLNLNGGTENAQIYATFNTRNAKGIGLGADRKEFGGRINTNFRFFDGFMELRNSISYEEAKANFGNNGTFDQAMILNPTETPYNATDPTGFNIFTGSFDLFNPIAEIRLRSDKAQYKNLLANSVLKINLSKEFYVSGMVSVKNDNEYKRFYRSAQHRESRANNIDGYASQEYKTYLDKTLELTANYNKYINQHSLNAVAGYTYQDFNGEGFNANNSDFPVDGIEENDMGTGLFLSDGRAGLGSWKNPWVKLAAFFGRVNYSFKDRYILTGTLRHEGSSKFAPGSQWGTFYGVSGAWRVSEEAFMKSLPFISDLKLRAGYGTTGNEGFDAKVARRIYGADTWWLVNGVWSRTYGVLHNQNKNIKWEVKRESNAGLDFALFNDKIVGRFDVYKRKVVDMIYNIAVSQPPAIYNETTTNVGSMENKGYEIELNWNAVAKKDFTYNMAIIASSNKSTLTTLNGGQTFLDRKGFGGPGNPGNAVRLFPGQDIGQFFLWRYAGITDAGNWMLYDKNGEAFDVTKQTKTIGDKAFMGNAIPKLILSWNHTATYKNFDASIYMRSWLGHDVFNMSNFYYGIANVKDRNILESAYEKNKNIKGEKELTDYWLENGNFLKVDALNVGYTFRPQVIKPFKGLRLYATARNLFVLTKYSGLDPEVNINGLEPGFEERSPYPKTRTFMFGLQANF